MSQEIRLAFAHPSERSMATDDGAPLDRISLRDHIVEVEIGAFQQERGTTQRVCFNVVVEVAQAPDLDDDVDRILSYDRVTEAIAHELAAERLNLLETLADRIAERILVEPQAVRAFVRIEKLDRGPGALGVEIVRSRQQLRDRPGIGGEDGPHPRVVFVSNLAIHSDHLNAQIDALETVGEPVIFCVGLPDGTRPHSTHPLAQRRIDLLAMEQNAWVLAGRDARCVVVASRTEIDWAMKHGQFCVWAPSKIVLDAVEGPGNSVADAQALAAWFARTFGASGLSDLGGDVP
ncbi:dihydroneopterin aldolase [Mesobacterium sp. TK19101]|uniref:dihydroneopterin aldolase n=1 Tax=Mesobacterium hydrothermale TaxID=3111907 RepID=A0ABU6HGR9_9RHOB|nr:dihydroneopterin aldolase [Mesobacterium sp. TK19101]MEC3861040.1 dihydroneopterin aldolase [Mesobacterium sp. TK19101]